MTASLVPFPVFRAFDPDGAPLAGGKLYTYAAGSLTPLATYTDQGGGTENANPVILDANGSANVWLAQASYKMTLKDSEGNIQWTVDNIEPEAALILANLANTSNVAKGDALIGVKQHWSGAVGCTQDRKNSESNSIWDAMTLAQSTAAANKTTTQADVATTTAIFNAAVLGAKKIYLPAGLYYLEGAYLQDGTEIYGDGPATILRQPETTAGRMMYASGTSADPEDNLKGIYIHDLRFEGKTVDAWSDPQEQQHLLLLNGVSDLTIERVEFVGWQGDAVFIGSGDQAEMERHNERVTIRKCLFDGVNKINRQGISVLDCDGLLVQDCSFKNTTYTTMPGAIDFEPEYADSYSIVRNCTIQNCRFDNIGGNVGTIGFLFKGEPDVKFQNFLVEGCTIENCAYGITFANKALATTYTNNLVIDNCVISNLTNYPLNINFINGVVVSNTTLSDCEFIARFQDYHSLRITNCEFERVSSKIEAGGLTFWSGNGLNIDGCNFTACGDGDGISSGIYFVPEESSSNISICNCNWYNPGPPYMMPYAVFAGGHTIEFATSRMSNCNVGTSTNAWPGQGKNIQWTPALVGASGGTPEPTYTEQYGVYNSLGDGVVAFNARVIWSAKGGSAGQMSVTLPFSTANQVAPYLYPVEVITEGIALTTSQVPVAAVYADVSKVIFYTQDLNASTITPIQMPTSGTVMVNGTAFI